MRRWVPFAVLAALVVASASADGLADARACLATLAARDPVRATVTVEVRPLPDPKATKDARKREPASLAVEAAEIGGAITVTAPAELVAALRAEASARNGGKQPADSLKAALDEVRVDALAGRLDAGAAIASRLAGATLVSERPDTSHGAGARLLLLRPPSSFTEEDRKHAKSLKEELRVWIGGDGCPLASESTSEGKFRFMVFSAEFSVRSSIEYTRVGDRLIAAREEREVNGEGMGQHSRSATTVTVAPHPREGTTTTPGAAPTLD